MKKMLIHLSFLFLFVIYLFNECFAERCPIIFGDSECPKGYNCVLSECKDINDQTPPKDCEKNAVRKQDAFKGDVISSMVYHVGEINCPVEKVSYSQNTAKSFVSDCGPNGVCLNGRCFTDKCVDIQCLDDEQCRDGNCIKVMGNFCWNSFDCGIGFRCEQHRCIKSGELLAPPKEKCDPGEVLVEHQCKSAGLGCSTIVCDPGEICTGDGVCGISTIDCKQQICPEGLMCGPAGLCVVDPCLTNPPCPVDHACKFGNCHHLQGLPCYNNREICSSPYECINGLCTRNECRRKVCQIGERCVDGLCIRINGRLCTVAIRDCGPEFDCHNGTCQDRITVLIENQLVENVNDAIEKSK